MAETFDYISVTTEGGTTQYKVPKQAEEYDPTKTYSAGTYCTHEGGLYCCNVPITTPEAWTAAHWNTAMLAPEVADLKSQIDLGCITVGIKDALIAAFNHVVWDDDDPTGQTYIDALYDALYNRYWQVTNTLSHCTTSNGAEQTIKGNPYTATITASTGYTMTGATVSVTMGGTDITSTAYSNGTISIPAVTGALVITITAAVIVPTSISAVFTQGDHAVLLNDTLDSLKPYLVVTASYDGGTTETVDASAYTLSGTLTAGTSTITVTYATKTTTFTVAVGDANRVSYIKSSGTQYINTGLVLAYYDEVEITIKDDVTSNEDVIFMGVSNSNNYRTQLNHYKTSADYDKLLVRWGDGVGEGINGQPGTALRVLLKNNSSTVKDAKFYNATSGDLLGSVSTSSSAESKMANANLYLFGRNSNGTANLFSSISLYDFVVKNQSGTVRMHLVPVLKGTTPCLYDAVSKGFLYNAGSGSFSYA